jgi:hypothetical protein
MVIPRSISSCLLVSFDAGISDDQSLPSVGESHVTSLGTGDNTSLGNQRVGKGRLSVVDVGDNRHVSDVGRSVHETSDLVNGEAATSVHVASSV